MRINISEVIGRSESSLGEEIFKQCHFMLRAKALTGEDFSDISFSTAERREILTAIIKQPVYDRFSRLRAFPLGCFGRHLLPLPALGH